MRARRPLQWLRLRLVWLRTPLRLVHFPGIAVAVVAAAVVLAGTGTASRLFLASTGEAAFKRAHDPRQEVMRFAGYESPYGAKAGEDPLRDEESGTDPIVQPLV
ncbi:MAG TPA: hypothetical protein VF995_03210, partial [Actinomycetota bacterium]